MDMDYVLYAIGALFILYQLVGKNFFTKRLMNSMIRRVADPSMKYASDVNIERVTAMYFYYACLIFTCQKRNLSAMARTLIDLAFRQTLTNIFNFKELPQEIYMDRLKYVFYIIDFLDKSDNPPEILMNLIAKHNKTDDKFGWLSFDVTDSYAKASTFYIYRVGPTVDFLLETSKHYPD